MVLQLQSKGSKLAAGLQGLREGLGQGFAMGQTARRTQLAEREQAAQEERYRQSVALASQAAALDAQREQRYADEQARNNQLQDEQRQGMRELTNARIESITPEQTAAGAPRIDGIGPAALSKFGAGLMQHHDRVLSHAKSAAKNIPPEFLDQFWGDVSSGLQNDQQKAQIAKFQSDLEGFGNDANTELGGGPVQDLMGEPGDGQTKKGSGALGRFSELKSLLDSIAGQDPMLASSREERQKQLNERQRILQTVAQGIGQTHDLLNQEELRRKTVAATVQEYEPKLAMERQAIAAISGPIRTILEQRVNAKELALIQYKRDRNMTADDLQKALHNADQITLPTQRTGTTSTGTSDAREADRELRIREKARALADKEYKELVDSGVKGADLPTKEALIAKNYLWLGGAGDNQPDGQAAPAVPPSPAIEKAVMNGDDWQAKVQELVDSGRGREARELFMKARGEQFNYTSKPGNEADKLPTDGKKLLRARR